MYMSKEEMNKALVLIAEACNRPLPSEVFCKFVHNQCGRIEDYILKEAFLIFAVKGKWPTVDAILKECGQGGPMSRQEREEAKLRKEKEERGLSLKKEGEDDPFWEFYNLKKDETIAFEWALDGHNRPESRKVFDERVEKLRRFGWRVDKEILLDKCVTEEIVGRSTHRKDTHKMQFWCTRVRMTDRQGNTLSQ
jgi:hypothetical protein